MDPSPFIKMPGGKTKLLPDLTPPILDWLRSTPGARYFEPMLGGGAVFFGLRAAGWTGEAVLSDANKRLIALFRQVQSDPITVTEQLRRLFASYAAYETEDERAAFYYEVRSFDGTQGDLAEAVRFLFLNATAFNGLYRVNGSGQFNAPHGRTSSGKLPDIDRKVQKVLAASKALVGASLHAGDYRDILTYHTPKAGDVAYMDPPYPTEFTSYTADGFSEDDQQGVRDVARLLAQRGVRVALSNLDCPLIRELYPESEWHLRRVEVRHQINRDGAGRKPVGELIITAR